MSMAMLPDCALLLDCPRRSSTCSEPACESMRELVASLSHRVRLLRAAAATGAAQAEKTEARAAAAHGVEVLVAQLFKQLVAGSLRCSEDVAFSGEDDDFCRVHQSMVSYMMECGLPMDLLACLEPLDSEARKAAAHILCVFVQGGAEDGQVVEYMTNTAMAQQLVDTCLHPELFFLGSRLLRAAGRCRGLVSMLLETRCLFKLLKHVLHPKFKISNEGFSAVQDVMLSHAVQDVMLSQKGLVASHLKANLEEFCELYHPLLQHTNYVVQRQALKFLGQVLLDPEFQGVMLQYVRDERFLQLHMDLLHVKSRTIPLDAFHIFKIFVASPQQPHAIREILCRNGRRLISLLGTFRCTQCDDACREDLDMVIELLGDFPSQ